MLPRRHIQHLPTFRIAPCRDIATPVLDSCRYSVPVGLSGFSAVDPSLRLTALTVGAPRHVRRGPTLRTSWLLRASLEEVRTVESPNASQQARNEDCLRLSWRRNRKNSSSVESDSASCTIGSSLDPLPCPAPISSMSRTTCFFWGATPRENARQRFFSK